MTTGCRAVAAVVGLTTVLALAACGSSSLSAVPPPGQASVPSPSATSATVPSFNPSGTAPLGSTWTYPDGLKVAVSKPSRFTPTDQAYGLEPGQTAVGVTVTVTNGSDTPFDLLLTTVSMAAGPSGVWTTAIVDPGNGMDTSFNGTVLPGDSATQNFGFSAPPDQLGVVVVQVSLDSDHDIAAFSGPVS